MRDVSGTRLHMAFDTCLTWEYMFKVQPKACTTLALLVFAVFSGKVRNVRVMVVM